MSRSWRSKIVRRPRCAAGCECVHLLDAERGFLPCPLDLNEPVVGGHDDVHIDVGIAVKDVIEVKMHVTIDQADGDSGEVVGEHSSLVRSSGGLIEFRWRPRCGRIPVMGFPEWCGKALSSFDQSTNRQPDSKARRSDRCTPRTAVRIQDVTVDDEGQWAKGLEIDRKDEAIAR